MYKERTQNYDQKFTKNISYMIYATCDIQAVPADLQVSSRFGT